MFVLTGLPPGPFTSVSSKPALLSTSRIYWCFLILRAHCSWEWWNRPGPLNGITVATVTELLSNASHCVLKYIISNFHSHSLRYYLYLIDEDPEVETDGRTHPSSHRSGNARV